MDNAGERRPSFDLPPSSPSASPHTSRPRVFLSTRSIARRRIVHEHRLLCRTPAAPGASLADLPRPVPFFSSSAHAARLHPWLPSHGSITDPLSSLEWSHRTTSPLSPHLQSASSRALLCSKPKASPCTPHASIFSVADLHCLLFLGFGQGHHRSHQRRPASPYTAVAALHDVACLLLCHQARSATTSSTLAADLCPGCMTSIATFGCGEAGHRLPHLAARRSPLPQPSGAAHHNHIPERVKYPLRCRHTRHDLSPLLQHIHVNERCLLVLPCAAPFWSTDTPSPSKTPNV